jgi:tyrosinase
MASFPGVHELPTAREVSEALAVEVYDSVPYDDRPEPGQSFRNNLEGWRDEIGEDCEDGLIATLAERQRVPHRMHNGVHLWVSGMVGEGVGTMGLNTSPNDPVFWLHHANVDRLWEAWSEVHGREYLPEGGWPRSGENLRDVMPPYGRVGLDTKPIEMLDPAEHGYRYESLPEAGNGEPDDDAAQVSAPAAAGGTPTLTSAPGPAARRAARFLFSCRLG